MQKKAIIFVGIQASGKLTFYRERLKPLGYAHISMDQLHYRKREQHLLDLSIASEVHIIIDNTNPTREGGLAYSAVSGIV